MKVIHGRAPDTGSVRQGETFTGDVWADPVLTGVDMVSVHNVFFVPRARTHWHRHDAGQILRVTGGSGLVCARGREALPIRAGDVVWIEPGEEHWHGADEGTCLSHVAISLGGHEWLEPVTDEDYAAGAR